MRIGMFYRDYLSPGGIPREMHLLNEHLSRGGHTVHVYCYGDTNTRTYDGESVMVHSYHSPFPRARSLLINKVLGQRLRANADDLDVLVLVGSFIPENVPVARLASAAGIPIVVSPSDAYNPALFRGAQGLKKSLYERLFERRILESAKIVRLYSSDQLAHFEARGYSLKDRVIVAKEGVDWESIHAEVGADRLRTWRSTQLLHSGLPMFGFLGRVRVYHKGLDLLLLGWKRYLDSGGAGSLKIVGPASSEDKNVLSRMISELRIREVTIESPVEGAARFEFLRSLSALVHPSRHEGIPRVIREAFAVGCPCIVTVGTNLHDVVDAHHAGLVATPDPVSLASRMRELVSSEEAMQAFRQGALAAGAALDWPRIAREFGHEMERRLRLPELQSDS